MKIKNKDFIEEADLGKNLKFARTSLGEAVFIRKDADDAGGAVRPEDWSPKELRKMADFMEENPNCTVFIDGSGEPCC